MQIVTKSIFDAPLERPALVPGIRLGSGWHVGETPAWSRSRHARLVVDAGCFPEPRPLLVRLRVFNAAPHRPKRLRFESPGHAPVTVQVTTHKAITVLLHTPRHPQGAKDSGIELELDHLDSPYLTGHSADERLLGLSIVDLVPDAPVIVLPLEFGTARAAGSVLIEGWAGPEAHGTWSTGPRAVLHLPGYLYPGHPAELVFEGLGLPLPGDRPPLEVDVFEAGVLLTTWRLDGSAPTRLTCPPFGWSNNCDRRIELFIRNPCSPASLGFNADERQLGVLLQRLYLAD